MEKKKKKTRPYCYIFLSYVLYASLFFLFLQSLDPREPDPKKKIKKNSRFFCRGMCPP